MKSVLDTLDEVPEAIHGEYEERDGKFVLKLEGEPPAGYAKASDVAEAKQKVVTFRDSYTGLLKQVAELAGVEKAEDLEPIKAKLAKYDGIDPEEFKALKAQADALGKKGVKKPEDFANVVKEQVGEAIKPLRDELEAEKAARLEAQKRADASLLRETVGARAVKAGAKQKALSFILAEAERVFEVADNKVKARDGHFSHKQAGEPITVDEWISAAVTEYDFAFEPSKGGGASGSGPGGPSAKVNGKFKTPDGTELNTDGITVL